MTCSPSNIACGKFDSCCPNLALGTSIYFSGGQYENNRSISQFPADSFAELLKSHAAFNSLSHMSCISLSSYRKASTAYERMTAYSTDITSASLNQFAVGICTELYSKQGYLLCGQSTQNSLSSYRAQIGSALSAYTHTLYFFFLCDIILQVDPQTKSCILKY